MYNIKKGSNIKLSDNFNSNEFDCNCNRESCVITKISRELIKDLQLIRDIYGKTVSVSSGYRCDDHNKAIGGVKGSQHTQGKAADLTVKEDKFRATVEMDILREIIVFFLTSSSIGTYTTFTHYDIRNDFRRW